MEGILSGANSLEIIPYDLTSSCVYFPVRHHSPICSFHLTRTLEAYQPDCVLVEGPETANGLLPLLTHPDAKPPLAFYCALRDEKGRLGEKDELYRCYYPFLDCSPELTALRWASEHKKEARFIDLPYSGILLASKAGQGLRRPDERRAYQDEGYFSHGEFLEKLCEKTGLRNFDEFWEKYFEVNGLSMTTEDFVGLMHTYCILARENTKDLESDGCLARESHMARNVSAACGQFSKVLVVTGGFHCMGLLHPTEIKQPKPFPEDAEQIYPMIYTMEAADALNGYASGMQSPGFYCRVWDKMRGEDPEAAYGQTVLDLIAACGRTLRHNGEALSVADETCALDMARGLCALRGKAQPGLYELRDGVTAAFIKGEETAATSGPLQVLRKLTTGDAAGVLPDCALVPPLVADFQRQCQKLGINLKTTQRQQSILNIFSSPKHREVSRFFHRTVFLNCRFASLTKGPDLAAQKDRSLIRETWAWRWDGSVMASLVDQSVSGGTVRDACGLLLERQMMEASLTGDGAGLLVQGFLMGLEDTSGKLHGHLRTLAASDGDFFSLARACGHLNTLLEMGRLYRQEDTYDYRGLLDQCFGKVLSLLPSMAAIKDAQLSDCLSLISRLYQLSARKEFANRREGLLDALESLLEETGLHPGLHGGALGLLYGADPSWQAAIEKACGGYLRGSRDQMMHSASFLRGLFSTARDLVLVSRQFLPSLDALFARLEESDFLSLLPELRLAFRAFTPAEAARIARRAAALHGVSPEVLRRPPSVHYAYGETLDAWVTARLGWKPSTNGSDDPQTGKASGAQTANPQAVSENDPAQNSKPQTATPSGNGSAQGTKPQTAASSGNGSAQGTRPQTAASSGNGSAQGTKPQTAASSGNGSAQGTRPQAAASSGNGSAQGTRPQSAASSGNGSVQSTKPQAAKASQNPTITDQSPAAPNPNVSGAIGGGSSGAPTTDPNGIDAQTSGPVLNSEGAILNRWRLVLGDPAQSTMPLEGKLALEMDEALDFLYSREAGADEYQEEGGSGPSKMTIPAWLRKVRDLFPHQTAQVLERHALERYQMTELLTDPEILERMEPNQALLETILTLKAQMSGPVLAVARRIAAKVAEELSRKMQQDFRRSLLGRLRRDISSPVASMRNLDIKKTIRRNLKHYDPEEKRLVLEKVYFSGRVKRFNTWRIVMAVDESGSMADAVIHSAVMAGIFSRMPMVDSRLVIFDTQVVDLSEVARDPVETLMSVQLGGGTDIAKAMNYCQSLIVNPHRTIVILVSDLCEGGPAANLYKVCGEILESGAKLAALTALDRNANPFYNRTVAGMLAKMGAFVGALTPEQLGDYIGNIMQ